MEEEEDEATNEIMEADIALVVVAIVRAVGEANKCALYVDLIIHHLIKSNQRFILQ